MKRVFEKILDHRPWPTTKPMFVLKIVYSFIGVLMFLFPPQYMSSEELYYGLKNKFAFILLITRVDIYMAIFEFVGWLTIGLMMYFLWEFPYQTKRYKELTEEREKLILSKGGI